MTFKKLIVTLSNTCDDQFEIEYQIRNTESAQIWANCISKAQTDGLRETHRFYNFPNQSRSNLQTTLDELNTVIIHLKSLHPELDFPEIDLENLQTSINHLHFNFAHSHHVTKCVNPTNIQYWNNFNIILHQIETLMMNQKSIHHFDIPAARIVFTWKNQHIIPIPDSSYQDFTLGLEFGTAYINYAHIGRHFLEMFDANDDQLADEHIQPHRLISADTSLWFGTTLGQNYEIQKNKKIELWFNERKDRFNSLGHFWSDPKLALGRIPVARLIQLKNTPTEINEFIKKISIYDQVHKVQVF